MNKYAVKLPTQPDRSHVSFGMFAFRVYPPALIQHGRREVRQCHCKMFLEVKRVVTATGERDMDASAMLEYFAPLKAWLDRQNAGHPVGWTAPNAARSETR